MKITDFIKGVFRRGSNTLAVNYGNVFGQMGITCHPFGQAIFLNICDLLTDLANDVTFTHTDAGDNVLFAEFKTFYDNNAQFILNRLFENGYEVIGWNEGGFRVLKQKEYYLKQVDDVTSAEPYDKTLSVYVMRSPTYRLKGVSDATLLRPFIVYLDNIFNASNTSRERMGAFIIGSPKTYSGAPTATVLRKEDKEKYEDEASRMYGTLSHQKKLMLCTQEMAWTTINLQGLDSTTEKDVRLAICAICDRIKVPSNQVAIIDSASSKSLSNGSELREGDYNKYQSFERLLNRTFIDMARKADIKGIDYTIYNKPQRVAQTVE